MNEESLFHVAIGKPPGERQVFLDQACAGDPLLRRRLDALVLAHDGAGSFLREPVLGVETPVSENVGSQVGPYRLLERLGEGGMGVVFMAEQERPVARRVALKIVKPGLDSRAVLARFEVERQSLALMDHPSIAKVFEAGSTESGRPYFVMELVHGVPITDWCDARAAPPRTRLQLFVAVCQAVQHAHQKGIVHRDLKPSNVLVTSFDDQPVPKVIDFGLAKATDAKLAAQTLFTKLGLVVGTPEYMSPEQADIDPHDVDTRSDVYSLGVLLYELLTGSTPIERQPLQDTALLELLRRIKEEEPPAPSTRLAATPRSAAIASQRGMRPSALRGLLRGELDWIVMKALDKDRNRRYESASALAQDVQRYLDGEPVLAHPPSTFYRLRKIARRPAVRAALAFVVVLVAGVVASVWQAVEATGAREEARASEEQAMDALRALTDDVVERQMHRLARLTDEDRAFLGRILAHYERFAAAKGDSQASQELRAQGIFRVAMIRSRLGERDAAIAAYRRADELYARLAARSPTDHVWRQVQAKVHNNLALLHGELGQDGEAETQQRRAIDIESRLVAERPQDDQCRLSLAYSRTNLSDILSRSGRWEAAETELREAIRALDALPVGGVSSLAVREALATTHNNLGSLLRTTGRAKDSEAAQRQAIAVLETMVADSPRAPGPRSELARSQANLAIALAALEKPRDAVAELRKALHVHTRLAADYPTLPEYQQQLARNHANLGCMLARVGELEEAEAECRLALAIARRLVTDLPGVPQYMQDLAQAHSQLASVLDDRDRIVDAKAECEAALELRQRLMDEFPTLVAHAVELGGSQCNLGNLLQVKEGQIAESLVWYERAIATLSKVVQSEPSNATAREFLRNSHQGCAKALLALDRDDEATPHLDRIIELSLGAVRDHHVLVKVQMRVQGEPVEAMRDIEALLQRGQIPASELANVARLICVAADSVQDAERREAYAARAVEVLERAWKGGGFADRGKFEELKRDSTLAPLRRRSDFRQLFTMPEPAGK